MDSRSVSALFLTAFFLSTTLFAQEPGSFADLILKNGKIVLGAGKFASAVSIRQGSIYTIGPDALIEKEKGPQTKVVNLNGKVVLPAFNDADCDLFEGGLSLSINKIESPSKDDLKKALLDSQKEFFSNGIVNVQSEVKAIYLKDAIKALEELYQNNELQMRISLWPILEDADQLTEWKKKTAAFPDYLFELTGLTLYLDEPLIDKKASLIEKYATTEALNPEPRFAREKLEALTLKTNRLKFPIAFHASGDLSLGLALNALSSTRRQLFNSKVRNRIVGLDLVHPAQIESLRKNAVVAVVRPGSFSFTSEEKNTLPSLVGATRAKDLFALKNMIAQSAPVALATDWPRSALNPFVGVYAAVTRLNLNGKPTRGFNFDQKISLEQALSAFTMGSAFATKEDHYKGSIAEGKFADLIVLDKDPFFESHLGLSKTSVLMTIANGRIVYNRLVDF